MSGTAHNFMYKLKWLYRGARKLHLIKRSTANPESLNER